MKATTPARSSRMGLALGHILQNSLEPAAVGCTAACGLMATMACSWAAAWDLCTSAEMENAIWFASSGIKKPRIGTINLLTHHRYHCTNKLSIIRSTRAQDLCACRHKRQSC